jgi:hypothetical protein
VFVFFIFSKSKLIFWWSFFPGDNSTPLFTSIAAGLTESIASKIIKGLIPTERLMGVPIWSFINYKSTFSLVDLNCLSKMEP